MRREVYTIIAVTGLVFTVLSEFVSEDRELALTFLLTTIFLLGYLFLLGEYRYYREHNALLASLQFLAVPILLLTLGNILAPNAYEAGFIEITIDFIWQIDAESSYVSGLLILPLICILLLTARYYDGRYPGFVIRRRQFGNFKLPFLIHLISITLIVLTSMWRDLIDIVALLFVVLSIGQMVQKIILPPIINGISESRSSRQQSRASNRERRSFLNSITGNGPSSRSRGSSYSSNRSNRSSSSSNSSSTSPSRGSNTSQRRRRSRGVSTAPSEGYREIPTRSRNSSRPSSNSRSRPAPSRPAAQIDRGVDAVTPSKKRKVKKGKVTDYLPKGNYDASDLQCVICYSTFSENSNQNIVVCPSCKFPGHEVEFLSWLNTSNRCPRCNKEIQRRGLKSGTVSESQYAKFIKKFK